MPALPVSYSCRAVESARVFKMIWSVTSIGLGLMFVLIYMGLSAWLIVGIFIAALFWLINKRLMHATYTVSESGVQEVFKERSGRPRDFSWSQIKSFLLDEEMTRYHGVQKFLKIRFQKPRYTMMICEGYETHQKEEFKIFSESFLKYVPQNIAVEKGFYQKPIAKVLALLFLAAAIALTVLGFVMPLGFSGMFRLSFIIIPGTFYMLYRSFKKS